MSGLPTGTRAKLEADGQDGFRIGLYLDDKFLGHLNVDLAGQEHRNFILSTWVRSYQNQARKFMDKDIYADEEARVAEELWERTWVATSPNDSYVIHGWVCTESNADTDSLFHAYVPPDLRRHGIATALVNVECRTTKPLHVARPGFSPFGFKCKLNPYILRGAR